MCEWDWQSFRPLAQNSFSWLKWTSFILSTRRSFDSRLSSNMFGNRLFIECNQEQQKRTAIKTHGDLISSSANLGTFDLILHDCRHRIALKFGRRALRKVWKRLPKFQTFSSKFIFMTGMNLVHSLNQEVIWLQTVIKYVWQLIIYWMRPGTAKTDCHKDTWWSDLQSQSGHSWSSPNMV